MASEFVRKIDDTRIEEEPKETSESGDLLITHPVKDDDYGDLSKFDKDTQGGIYGHVGNQYRRLDNGLDLEAEENRAKKEEARIDKKVDDETTRAKGEEARIESEVVHNTGNETIAGTKTFADGVSLSGKNVVDGVTDTDWLDITLPEGITGTAQYKVTMGRVAVHFYGIKGITASGNNSQGKICTLPVYTCPYTSRYIFHAFNSNLFFRQITITPNGDVYVSNDMGTPMSEDDQYLFDGVLI